MENEHLPSSHSASSVLILNSLSKKYLKQTANWIKFLSVVGIIFSIDTAVMQSGFFITVFPNFATALIIASASIIGDFLFAVLGIFFIYAAFRLFQFSKKVKQAIETNDETDLELALKRLRSAIHTIGILTIIMLVYYGLNLLVFLVAGDSIMKSVFDIF
ncbi:MAG: hypothetical protein JWN78_1755 [Bacteroidota bacterium]|nr:hypothetical protein [Bacteroidota bacterium]